MKTYKVVIREILEKEIEVNAESEREAIDTVIRGYVDEKYILDYSDFKEYEVEVVK